MLSSKRELSRFQQVSEGTRVSHIALLWQRGSGQKHPVLPQGPLRSTWHVTAVSL